MAGPSIRFPKMNVAQSTVNRILNVAAGMPAPPVDPSVPPPLPDVRSESNALDAQLTTPPVPVELPAGADGAVVDAALTGESLSIAATAPLTGT